MRRPPGVVSLSAECDAIPVPTSRRPVRERFLAAVFPGISPGSLSRCWSLAVFRRWPDYNTRGTFAGRERLTVLFLSAPAADLSAIVAAGGGCVGTEQRARDPG